MDTIRIKRTNKIQGQDGHIFVDDGGSGDLPIVFTHSFGGDATHWNNQLAHLRSSRRAVAFDFRSHGKSDSSNASSYTAEALAGDIAAVVDNLDLEKFVLVGHSMGGSAAIAYADTHPNRVAGLVLTGTPGKTPEEISKPVITSLQSDAYQKVMDEYMKQLTGNAKPEVSAKVNAGVTKLSKETSISIIRSAFAFDPIDKLERYKGPVLIIYTPNEKKQPNSLHNQVPGVPSRMIEGASHWTQLDKPELFNDILDEFLKKVSKQN